MKRILFALIFLSLLLASCAPRTAEDQIPTQLTAPAETEAPSKDFSTEPQPTESTRRHEWVDVDGDGEEEYVPIYEIWEFDLDTIFSNPDLKEQFFESSDFNVWDYDTETIMSHPELLDYVLNNCDFYDHVEMQETPYSTCFSSIGYHPIWESLIVVFRDSGYRYRYYDVPPEVGYELLHSGDPGEYYNEAIKGRYDCDGPD